MSDDRYTNKLAQRRVEGKMHLEERKILDGRDGQIADRLPRSGSERMRGPVQLVNAQAPTKDIHAAPRGYANSELSAASRDAGDSGQKANKVSDDADELDRKVKKLLDEGIRGFL